MASVSASVGSRVYTKEEIEELISLASCDCDYERDISDLASKYMMDKVYVSGYVFPNINDHSDEILNRISANFDNPDHKNDLMNNLKLDYGKLSWIQMKMEDTIYDRLDAIASDDVRHHPRVCDYVNAMKWISILNDHLNGILAKNLLSEYHTETYEMMKDYTPDMLTSEKVDTFIPESFPPLTLSGRDMSDHYLNYPYPTLSSNAKNSERIKVIDSLLAV